jgi:NAD(P)-dependent dehydrogenase (short-subunit alcohol dehydrogenase family)
MACSQIWRAQKSARAFPRKENDVTQVPVAELFDLKGKLAVVTGGARNLGYDSAMALAEAGADVVITSREQANADKSAAELSRASGRTVVGLACDVRYEDQVENLVSQIMARFGRIDILVNNAGNVVSTPDNAPLEKRPLSEWSYTIDVNMTGVFLCTKHVVEKAMHPSEQGVIINIASLAGMLGKDRSVYRGTPMGGVTIDYVAAKGGVIAMTREMACYLAPKNIRVNSISPGGFWRGHSEIFTKQFSELVPMKRMGKDGKELKGAVLFLASEASSYVTGINLPVDGGMSSW